MDHHQLKKSVVIPLNSGYHIPVKLNHIFVVPSLEYSIVLVPLNEKKTQRSITLPDRLWEFAKENKISQHKTSYTEGIRFIVEEAYQSGQEIKQ
jgi:hypothetical protein